MRTKTPHYQGMHQHRSMEQSKHTTGNQRACKLCACCRSEFLSHLMQTRSGFKSHKTCDLLERVNHQSCHPLICLFFACQIPVPVAERPLSYWKHNKGWIFSRQQRSTRIPMLEIAPTRRTFNSLSINDLPPVLWFPPSNTLWFRITPNIPPIGGCLLGLPSCKLERTRRPSHNWYSP